MNVLIESLLNTRIYVYFTFGVLKCINALIMVHDKSNAI